MNKLNIHNNSNSTGFYFKGKIIEGSCKVKSNRFFDFLAFLLKMYIFEVVTFFVA